MYNSHCFLPSPCRRILQKLHTFNSIHYSASELCCPVQRIHVGRQVHYVPMYVEPKACCSELSTFLKIFTFCGEFVDCAYMLDQYYCWCADAGQVLEWSKLLQP